MKTHEICLICRHTLIVWEKTASKQTRTNFLVLSMLHWNKKQTNPQKIIQNVMKQQTQHLVILIDSEYTSSVGICEIRQPQQTFLNGNTTILVWFAHKLQWYELLSKSLCVLVYYTLHRRESCDIHPEQHHHIAFVSAFWEFCCWLSIS